MKQIITVPPSSTPVTVEITIPDVLTVIQSGGTSIGTPPTNQPPTANAGTDLEITLPINAVRLRGIGLDPERLPIAFQWKIVSGGAATIVSPNASNTDVVGLTEGPYIFRLTVTDDKGLTKTDDVGVTVKPAIIIVPPTVGGIEGYGAQVTGGAGQQTIRITNLSQFAGAIGSNRIIIFDISGTINGGFNLNNLSNLTIDAYTSKQDITITGGSDGMNIDGCNNVIIRGLRFVNASNDGLNATGGSNNIVFDHCSSYNNGDGNIDLAATASAGKNFTVQWCIMGKNQGSGNMLITTQNASVHHNLFIGDGSGEGAERNPFAHSNYSPKGTQTSPNFDFRNNLVAAAGRYASGNGYGAVGNFVNNYYTSNKPGLINLCADPSSCSKAYVAGNFNQPSPAGGSSSAEYTIPAQYKINMTDAVTAAKAILQSVGPYKRDAYEQGVINSINISGSTPPPPVDPPPTGGGYTLVYQNGFDTWDPQNQKGDLDPFDNGQLGNGSLSTTIFKTGPGSFKSVPANVSSGIRSEVQFESEQTPKEGIVEYDVYYDNFFSDSGHSLQWHPSTNGGSGTGLYHKNGKLQFVTVKSGINGTNVGSPFSVSTKTWYHFKLTYKFGSAGYIKVEVDGVEKVNQNIQMGDGSSPYLKVGVNMWENQTSVVYYDNLKVYKKN